MTDKAAHNDPAAKGEPARHISMELIAEGARVTGLTMDGTRLVVTIEAELAASQVKTRSEATDESAAVIRPTESASRSAQKELAAAAEAPENDLPTDGTRPEPPGASLKSIFPSGVSSTPDAAPVAKSGIEDNPFAKDVSADMDSGLLAIRRKKAGPITFGPDTPGEELKASGLDSGLSNLVAGLSSEAMEPQIEEELSDAEMPLFESVLVSNAASNWDAANPIGTVSGSETRIPAEGRKSDVAAVPGKRPPEAAEAQPPAPGKPLSFESAMEAIDKAMPFEKAVEQPPKPAGKTISFGPLPEPQTEDRGSGSEKTGKEFSPFGKEPPAPIPLSLSGDAGATKHAAPSSETSMPPFSTTTGLLETQIEGMKTSLLETMPAGRIVPPAMPPGQFIPPPHIEADKPQQPKSSGAGEIRISDSLWPTADTPLQGGDGADSSPSIPDKLAIPAPILFGSSDVMEKSTESEDSNVIGGERHGEPKPSISFGFEDPEPAPGPQEKGASPVPLAQQPEPEQEKGTAKPEAGNTTILIRYTCPRCKTQGMQAVDKVGAVVNCTNCGKAMRLVMKK